MEIKIKGQSHSQKYNIDGSLDNNNSGFKPFATKKDILNYFEKEKIIMDLINQSGKKLRELPYEQIKSLKESIEKANSNKTNVKSSKQPKPNK